MSSTVQQEVITQVEYSKKLKEILDTNVPGISKIRRFYKENGDFTGF